MKAYLFLYDAEFGTREQAKALLDSIHEVVNWRYELPNSFYLISELGASQLSERVRAKRPSGRFLVAELGENRQGWLSPDSWKFLNEKKPA